MSSDEWKALPYESQQRLPITRNIPYFFRWKILQIKLLLNDVQYLIDKHNIDETRSLYVLLQGEAGDLCDDLFELIAKKRKWRRGLEQETV